MPRAAGGFLAAVLIGVAALVLTATDDRRSEVQSTGVLTIAPVAYVYPHHEACQRSIATIGTVDAVAFAPQPAQPYPGLLVRLRNSATGAVLAGGRATAAPDALGTETVVLDHPVGPDRTVDICFANHGAIMATLYGDDGHTDLCTIAPDSLGCRFHFSHPTSSTTSAYLGRSLLPGTMHIALLRDHPVTVAAAVPQIFRRASRFRPGFVGVGLWWALLAVGILVAPGVLWWGMRGLPDDRQRPPAAR